MVKKKSLMLYDFLQVKGGAESLTLTLCKALPTLDLGVGFINHMNFPIPPLESERIKTLCRHTELVGWQTLKVSNAFERKAGWIEDYDKVVFSGSNAVLAIKHRSNSGNILYCHTPPRFIYDLKEHYLYSIPLWQRPLLKLLIAYLQPRYENAFGQMNLIIANSKNVQQRIKKHLGKDSIVIYPPCHVDKYKWLSQGDYYLSTARIEPYKRIKLLVEAFMQMPDKQLVVASGGSELCALQGLARDHVNIRFTGWCEDETLQDLVGNCIATLYLPMDEDFGISPVESMAAGKPVIGVGEGGVRETLLDGVTGLLCPREPVVADVIAAVKRMTPKYALLMKDDCQERSKLYSAELFIEKMKKLLDCSNNELLKFAKTLSI